MLSLRTKINLLITVAVTQMIAIGLLTWHIAHLNKDVLEVKHRNHIQQVLIDKLYRSEFGEWGG